MHTKHLHRHIAAEQTGFLTNDIAAGHIQSCLLDKEKEYHSYYGAG